MAHRRYIPTKLLTLYPTLTIHEIRAVINVLFKSKDNIMRQADIFNVKIPGFGTLRSHASKKPKSHKKTKKRDVRRKRKEYHKKGLTKEKLLF